MHTAMRKLITLVALTAAAATLAAAPAGATVPARAARATTASHQGHRTKHKTHRHKSKRRKHAPAAQKAASAAPNCGGEVPPAKPGGGAWTCTFDDEFDAATGDANALNTNVWVPQVTATSGYTTGPALDQACYENSPANISVSGGYLHLTALKTSSLFDCSGLTYSLTQYTSGMVSTYERFSQTYGRFEVRAEMPQTAAKGLQETLWLWPDNDTLYGKEPASGEIDFSEFYSQYSSLDIPYVHYDYAATTKNASTSTNIVTADCPLNPAQFNDYALVWEPGTLTISINGATCMTDNYVPDDGVDSPAPFDQGFFIALTQALGITTNAFNPSTTPLPATTLIKYVRVWQ